VRGVGRVAVAAPAAPVLWFIADGHTENFGA